ncbi:MAG: hypothetical protein OET90_06655 [Desulfuromonadales bacterium]|nr:hypothetical protein [Desulfuromonadales bacterium]
MDHYLGVAREHNITQAEIGAIQGIVMAVSAGKVNSMMRQLSSDDAD